MLLLGTDQVSSRSKVSDNFAVDDSCERRRRSGSVDQDGVAPCCASRLDVPHLIANHDGALQIDAQFVPGAKEEARSRFPAITSVFFRVWAHQEASNVASVLHD